MHTSFTSCYICETCGYKDSVLEAMRDHETNCQMHTAFDVPDDELRSIDGSDLEECRYGVP